MPVVMPKTHNLYIFFALAVMGTLGRLLGYPNDFVHIPFLALLYPVALYYVGAKAGTGGVAFRYGWLLGIVANTAALYWLTIPVMQVGGLPLFLAIPCAVAIAAYVGLYSGLFSLLVHHLGKAYADRPVYRILALSSLWYALELVRSFLFTGFAWLDLSSAFAPWPLFIQGASLVGALGLSAVFVAVALFCAESIRPAFASPTKKTRIGLACLAFGGCGAILLWGAWTLHIHPETELSIKDKNVFSVIMVEGNVDQNIKWEEENQRATVKIYEDLSRKAVHALQEKDKAIKPLLIWPETSMPFYLDADPELGRRVIDFVREIQTPLLVGAPAVHQNMYGEHRPFNRAYLLHADGRLGGYYDKVHLVPFGEYVPSFLEFDFLHALLQGVGTFTPGTQLNPIRFNDLALGVLICYEGIFPNLAQERVENGANVLLIISNDGWFGHSPAPKQHLDLAIMRAVEQGRFLVRSTNTGISAIVDNFGRIRLQGEQFKATALIGVAQTKAETTFFHKFYPFIPYIFLVNFLFCIYPLFKRRKILQKQF